MTSENKVRTTVIIKKEIWKDLKRIIIDKELTQNQLINEYIEAGILRDKESTGY